MTHQFKVGDRITLNPDNWEDTAGEILWRASWPHKATDQHVISFRICSHCKKPNVITAPHDEIVKYQDKVDAGRQRFRGVIKRMAAADGSCVEIHWDDQPHHAVHHLPTDVILPQ